MFNRYLDQQPPPGPSAKAEPEQQPKPQAASSPPAATRPAPGGLGGNRLLGELTGNLGDLFGSILNGVTREQFDAGDILLVLIILLLLLDGDDLEIVITLALMLLLGLGDS